MQIFLADKTFCVFKTQKHFPINYEMGHFIFEPSTVTTSFLLLGKYSELPQLNNYTYLTVNLTCLVNIFFLCIKLC